MALARAAVRFTANFEANLANIAAYWAERHATHAYARLLDELGDTVIDNLERHPRIGRDFFARTGDSIEVRDRVAALLKRRGAVEVREYLSGDYLLLYCLVEAARTAKPKLTVHLLAIKHHRQLTFDLEGFWQAGRHEEG